MARQAKGRRENGVGSFALKPNGNYEYRITINGKRKSFSGSTKKECKDKADAYVQKLSVNNYNQREFVSLHSAMRNWAITVRASNLRQQSLDNLIYIIDHIVADTIGNYDYRDVTEEIVRKEFIERLMDMKTQYTNKPIARSTIVKARTYLNAFYSYCHKKGMLEQNALHPVEFVKVPDKSHFQTTKRTKHSFTEEELKKMIIAADAKRGGNYYYSDYGWAIILMYALGLRRQELLALRCDCIDLEQRLVYIKRTVVQYKNVDENQQYKEGEPKYITEVVDMAKNDSSIRTIPINNLAMLCINKIYERRKPKEHDLICSKATSKTISLRNFNRSHKAFLKYAGVEYVNPHGFRHAFATKLLDMEVDVKTVSVLLGHSSTNVTENVYQHVLDERKRKVVYKLDFDFENPIS